MKGAVGKVFVFCLMLAATMEQEYEDSGSTTPTAESNDSQFTTSEPSHQQTEFWTTEPTFTNESSIEDILAKLSPNMGLFLKEVKACREKYPNMNDRLFRFRLYCFLLNELTGESNNSLDFHCPISRNFIKELQVELHQLEIFQNFLNSQNDSCDYLRQSQDTHPATPVGFVQSHVEKMGVKDNLKLKLGDEWIPDEPKVSHVSHIYLGTSIFPILTEEYRIIEKERSYRKPRPTKSSFANESVHEEKPSHPKSHAASAGKIYQLLTPNRWEKSRQEKKTSRHYRSVQTASTTSANVESTENFNINSIEKPSSTGKPNLIIWTFRFTTEAEESSKNEVICPMFGVNQSKDSYHEKINSLCLSVRELIRKFLVSNQIQVEGKTTPSGIA